MATGVTLANMSRQTRAILGMSLNVAHGVDQEDSLREGLRRTQSDLWVMHDWPMLITGITVPVAPGERMIAIPDELDFNHINDVASRLTPSEKWVPLVYGIGINELNQYDSDADVRSDPIRRWQADPADPQQIEIWPRPATAQQIRFTGRVSLGPLVNDNDTCTLDSDLIISTYAAQQLARQNSADAQIQLSKSQAILNRLRGRQGASKREPFTIETTLAGGVR